MSRFIIDAEIDVETRRGSRITRSPRFTTLFVISARNADEAEMVAQDYLTEGGWWATHGARGVQSNVTVHDLSIRRANAEQIARAFTECWNGGRHGRK